MALNLSRNTKVFVSTANGVHASGGSLIDVDTFTGGTGHAVGDVITLSDGVKVIVTEITGSGVVNKVQIPNNFSSF